MKLYLCQHAEAKWEEVDPNRPLTEKGYDDAWRVAAHAAGHAHVRVRRILHSSKLRARQTAEVWAEYLSPVETAQAEDLDPQADPRVWADRLMREPEDTMLVGHLPHLARLASRLLCGDEGRGVVTFYNGGIVCLERSEGGTWSLQWAVTPAWCDANSSYSRL